MDANQLRELTASEDARLAREAAADIYGEHGISYVRDVFTDGRDAAMTYIGSSRHRAVHSEEENGYPSFRDSGMPLG
jgi:hypothetical protein